MLKDKNIVVGITGGIAAYKACDIISALRKKDANIYPILTKNASQFITPLTLQTISANKVYMDMFKEIENWEVEHIELAKKADLFLIVPATANFIGKLANGIADDMLTTTVMATKSQLMIAPAMNTNMYENEAVQKNIGILKSRGSIIIEPEEGLLACGDMGRGKLANVEDIVYEVVNYFEKQNFNEDLKGKKIIVTAGPTCESIDPVRYITNRSSGKMGYEIAKACILRGGEVCLISGYTNNEPPKGLGEYVQIESALDLYEAMVSRFDENHIVIQSAAVADYRPLEYSDKKIKKSDDDLAIKLTRNKDVALEVGKNKGDKILIGFAAETNDLLENAKKKIEKKNLDFIVANDLKKEGAGFRGDTNIAKIIDREGNIEECPLMTKKELAHKIVDKLVKLF